MQHSNRTVPDRFVLSSLPIPGTFPRFSDEFHPSDSIISGKLSRRDSVSGVEKE